MAGGNISFSIIANNKSAIAAMTQVQQAGAKLSGNISSKLGGAMAGAFSIGAITAAVTATVNYAEAIDDASQRLQTTTENVQALRKVADHTGVSFEKLEGSIAKVNDARMKALEGDKKSQAAFAKLGIGDKELQTMNQVQLSQLVAQKGSQLSTGDRDTAFADIFGVKMSGAMNAAIGELQELDQIAAKLKANGSLMSDEDIAKLSAAKDSFGDLMDTIKVKLAGPLVWIMDTLGNFITKTVQLAELFGTAIGAFSTVISTIKPWELLKALAENVVNSFQAVFSNIWDLIKGNKSIGEVFTSLGEQANANVQNALSKGFDAGALEAAIQTVDEKLLEMADEDKARAEAAAARAKARAEEQAGFAGPVNYTKKDTANTAAAKAAATPEYKPDAFKAAGNMSIGGTGAINTQFRSDRYSKQMIDLNIKMLEELKALNNKVDGKSPDKKTGFAPK